MLYSVHYLLIVSPVQVHEHPACLIGWITSTLRATDSAAVYHMHTEINYTKGANCYWDRNYLWNFSGYPNSMCAAKCLSNIAQAKVRLY